MPLLLRAADIVIGKPGGLSVSEALACGRPFLAICSLGGQESYNVAYLERHGVGSRIDMHDLPRAVKQWLSDPQRLASAQARAWSIGCRHGAELIADLVLRMKAARSGHQEGSQT
jgi:processive 1,2-diacylglycerol beta-glucosyltransferase